jgi:hypothetical protein
MLSTYGTWVSCVTDADESADRFTQGERHTCELRVLRRLERLLSQVLPYKRPWGGTVIGVFVRLSRAWETPLPVSQFLLAVNRSCTGTQTDNCDRGGNSPGVLLLMCQLLADHVQFHGVDANFRCAFDHWLISSSRVPNTSGSQSDRCHCPHITHPDGCHRRCVLR